MEEYRAERESSRLSMVSKLDLAIKEAGLSRETQRGGEGKGVGGR